MTDDKAAAYTVLYTVLTTLCKLTAPYTPFIAEMMYRNLVPRFFRTSPVSVHLCSFPVAEEEYIDKQLEAAMDGVVDIVILVGRRLFFGCAGRGSVVESYRVFIIEGGLA